MGWEWAGGRWLEELLLKPPPAQEGQHAMLRELVMALMHLHITHS